MLPTYTDKDAAYARTFVTDLNRATAAEFQVRRQAWAVLKTYRRERLEADWLARHQPGDAA